MEWIKSKDVNKSQSKIWCLVQQFDNYLMSLFFQSADQGEELHDAD